MILSYLARDEGKTLEFKENCRALETIVRTGVAFANTSGGSIVIGVRNGTREVVGVVDALGDEERLANAFADSIRPLLIPDIQIHAWRDREVLVVSVPHTIGPYYLNSEGPEAGVYIRLGSSNRRAGPEIIGEIRNLARNLMFDEQPYPEVNSEEIDFRVASGLFEAVGRRLHRSKLQSLELITLYGGREVPTIGAILLFGRERSRCFPDATIRCARFLGVEKTHILDQTEIDEPLPTAIERALTFVERHTLQTVRVGRVRNQVVSEYAPAALREAVINAVVHADYAIRGTGVKIAIFDDRIEISNPGFMPFGMTLETAMTGVSRLRNRVVGRVFRELGLIEQWGSGLGRILNACAERGMSPAKFEELGANFRVTLYHAGTVPTHLEPWRATVLEFVERKGAVSPKEAAQLWDTSDKTARVRLRKLAAEGQLAEVAISQFDPYKKYIRKKNP